jgi:anti-sigma factor (TIGR02949 family)
VTCREFVEFLNAYLDGDLMPAERSEFERHLAICPQCVRYLAGYENTVRLVQQTLAGGDDAPHDAPEQLIDAIVAAKRQGK